jgi:enoyl-CoA hydratase
LREIYQALDQAESDRAIVILTGRESVFSAGFDLNVMKRGGAELIRTPSSLLATVTRSLWVSS